MLPHEQFRHLAETRPNAPFLHSFKGKTQKTLTYSDCYQRSLQMARALSELDLNRPSPVVILSTNCPEWILGDLAIWMAGHYSVPLYPTLKPESVLELIHHSEAKVVLLGHYPHWRELRKTLPDDIQVYSLVDPPPMEAITFPNGPEQDSQELDQELQSLASIIYTSGTTGVPKGVMHNFQSMLAAPLAGIERFQLNENDRFFSYLPLAHIAERGIILMGSLYSGGQVYFLEKLERLSENLATARPTVFMGVPRVWVKMRSKIELKTSNPLMKIALKLPLAGHKLKKIILTKLGFDQIKLAITGAAPIAKEDILWWQTMGINLVEIYGMTENFGHGTATDPNHYVEGSVGQAWPGAQVTIGDNNEVLLGGPGLMQGYFKNEQLTQEALNEEGLLKSGDQGLMDKQGNLYLTGRVKDLFKTAKGKFVTPGPIEKRILAHELIEMACIIGNGMSYPVALIELKESHGQNDSEIQNELNQFLGVINAQSEHFERLACFVVLKQGFASQNNFLTPTMKIKRSVVDKHFQQQVEKWIEGRAKTIFIN